jgi:uncharacterized protein
MEVVMLIRSLFVVLLIACAGAAQAAQPDPRIKLALELMEVTHMDAMMKNMQEQMRGMFQDQFASSASCAAAKPIVDEFSGKLSDKLIGSLGSEDFKVDVAAVYVDVFTASELQELIDFYHTPLGQKMLSRMPELMQKSMLIMQAQMKALRPELEALSSDYGQRISEASATCASATEKSAAQ